MSERTQKLTSLFDLTLDALIEKVKSGQAEARDMAVVTKFLKDNGIECLPEGNPNLDILKNLTTEMFSGPADLIQ